MRGHSVAEVHEIKYKQPECSSQNTHLIKTKKSTCQDKSIQSNC